MFNEAHEGFDCRQPDVAGTRAVAPNRFNVRQKVHYKWCIDLFEIQFGGRHLETCAGKLKEQLKGIGITLAGMDARSTL